MRSKSRLTSRAVRCGVPLKTMCSRKWLTPETSGVSSRAPVRTKKPREAERAEGLLSPMRVRPLASVWRWNGMRTVLLFRDRQRLGAERDDGEVLGRVPAQVPADGLGRQGVDGELDLLEAADPAEVVPVGGEGAGPG